ncbi:MAG: ArsB/NhaD family transporter [Dehalobacter sp. 4CP]|uniref:SLC13 family permease n=1 Tax=Dehalobacter sp. CP TaxID=2594474 RepID=UPI0013C852F3|nr:ArsB/NhaD family transporter [Dehalobacter sp. 4CP]
MEFTPAMTLSVIIFAAAYLLIVTEKIDRVIIALGGGVLMALTGLLDQENPYEAIDFNTLALLISMMVIVMITQRTGVFEFLAIKVVKLAKGEPWKVLVYLSFITAVASAFLDNVTTILLILPITLDVTKDLKIKPIPFVISQIFASNIGGTATLIGDPPNIMIGTKAGLSFMDFVINVAPIIVPILLVTIGAFLLVYKKYLHTKEENKKKVLLFNEYEALKDKKLLTKCLIVLSLTILGFILHGVLNYPSSVVAMTGAVLLLLISKVKPEKVLKEVEWKTIFFFAGLFMLVGGLERAGVLEVLAKSIVQQTNGDMFLLGMAVLWVSAIASAFVDNIPFTATMIPLIQEVGVLTGMDITPLWWALSLGACLGGNGTIIGASANVVASGMAEEAGYKITFGQYFKVCFPIMLITVAISTVYLVLRYLI